MTEMKELTPNFRTCGCCLHVKRAIRKVSVTKAMICSSP